METWQIELLNRYEPELRPGLEPLDRTIDLPRGGLAIRIRQVRDMCYGFNWSREKLLAMAIIDLVVCGFDLEEEIRWAELWKKHCEDFDRRWREGHPD